MTRKRVAILISGGGSNMASLIADMQASDHPAMPVLVVSNEADAGGLKKAEQMGIQTAIVDHRLQGGDRMAFEQELDRALHSAAPDIICLAGFMRVLSGWFIARWKGKILNIHPSLLPLFRGLNTHQRVLDAGMAVHGCTVHEVTPELDDGPILGQAVLSVKMADTAQTLAARLLPLEHQLYPQVLRRFAVGDRSQVALI